VARTTVPRHHPRQEPGALAAPAGICAGGGEQSPSLPRPVLRPCQQVSWQEDFAPYSGRAMLARRLPAPLVAQIRRP
jgi:hypothetical protein